ncbi:TetR/AcrR family transcriptional regulator [Thiococcus pfennigii]|jgi:AcrR family transcriptional regulator|uniref:TetR/AcrR family transcriptional regulator n=1 Tax=Thiococcus pfennigii TaxID=1057 RepID=UPI001907D407|nr:TetR/AcrR family transcriptional regulator [Thiococcus pfennigii]MBK1733385.1 TetR family transcriptional regulator [Thiococcus pfennigii]
MPPPAQTPSPLCQARRQQILEAAAACFAREGFHGASVARLSKAAGMSPGHIYHFFENKEAIIAALIEQRLERSMEIARQFESAEDIFQAMIERVDLGLNEKTDPNNAALELEILAEAARNPHIAALVREADAVRRARFQGLIRQARQGRGGDGEPEAAVTEVLTALFEGLAARAVSHPDLDRDALMPVLQAALRALI